MEILRFTVLLCPWWTLDISTIKRFLKSKCYKCDTDLKKPDIKEYIVNDRMHTKFKTRQNRSNTWKSEECRHLLRMSCEWR